MDWVDTFVYLGTNLDGGGHRFAHIEYRVALAHARFKRLRKVWNNTKIGRNVKLRIYKTAVCSIVKYGSESWRWTIVEKKAINNFNSKCLAVITGFEIAFEARHETSHFNLEHDITRRRAAWLGHILRFEEGRLIRRVTIELYKHKYDGSIYDNVPDHHNINHLIEIANDRDQWRKFINVIDPRTAPPRPRERNEQV